MNRTFLLIAPLCLVASCAVPDRGEAPWPDATVSHPDIEVSEVATSDGDDALEIEDTAPPPVSYADSIHPILMANCTPSGCHSSGAGTFTLTGDVDSDYAETLEEVVAGDPQGSRLVKKTSGVSSHTGGPLLPPGSEEYDLVVAWIGDGAQP
ncbi:MAG: hypothetical protein U1F43_18260 [Myxococcota bacterium]